MGEHGEFDSAECGFAPLAADYALGELRGRKRRAFARHLEGCSACRSELVEAEILLESLREEARSPAFRAAIEPPRDLERRVLGRIAEARGTRRRSILLRAAACALLAGVAASLAVALARRGERPGGTVERGSGVAGAASSEETRARRAAEAWLLAVQEPTGAWSASRWGGHPNFDVGTTALAVLALEGSTDPAARDAARRGAAFILSSQSPGGRYGPEFVHAAYNQGLACLALARWLDRAGVEGARSRAAGREVEASLRSGLRHLAERQLPSGGWGEWVGGKPVTSEALSVWPAQALLAAEARGLGGFEAAAAAARRWIERGSAARARRNSRDPFLPSAPASLPGWREAAATLSDLFALGPAPLAERAPPRPEALLARQVREGPLAGSWDPSSDWGPASGRVQATALAALVLAGGPGEEPR